MLAAVGYGKLRPRFLDNGPAFLTHRASGDVIAVLLLVVGAMCRATGEDEHDATFHAVTGVLLLAVLTLKVIVVRWWQGAGRFPPLLGSAVFALLGLTWVGSAGSTSREPPADRLDPRGARHRRVTVVVVTAKLGPNAGDDSGKRTEQRDDSSGKGGDED